MRAASDVSKILRTPPTKPGKPTLPHGSAAAKKPAAFKPPAKVKSPAPSKTSAAKAPRNAPPAPESSEENEEEEIVEVLTPDREFDDRPIEPPLPRAVSIRQPEISHVLGQGSPLAAAYRQSFEAAFGVQLDALRIHTGPTAEHLARRYQARAFALGSDIVFGQGQFRPGTGAGDWLVAHEIAHVLQQPGQPSPGSSPTRRVTVEKSPWSAGLRTIWRDPTNAADDIYANAETPDDEKLEPGIKWSTTEETNQRWWDDLLFADVKPIRNYDPMFQPYAWANKTIRAQKLMRQNKILVVEDASLSEDGVFGPRTFLALLKVALDPKHPARADLEGLGFDLVAIAKADTSINRARAFAKPPEFLLQAPLKVLGENAVRYYDHHFQLVVNDRELIDSLLFDGKTPEGIRREDRIELLKRLYGTSDRKLEGSASFVKVGRDFINVRVDMQKAVERDNRVKIERNTWFNFVALSMATAKDMEAVFGVMTALNKEEAKLTPTQHKKVGDAVDLLKAADPFGHSTEPGVTVAILVAIYLPALDPAVRDPIVGTYLKEKAEKEKAERAAIEANNREAARQRADILVAIVQDEKMDHLVRMGRLRTEIRKLFPEKEFFDLVADDLWGREGNQLYALFTSIEDLGDKELLSWLVELCLSGHYAHDPRVQKALTTVVAAHESARQNTYIVDGDGAVLLDGTDRLEVGQVAGDINSHYLRDEDRERLKPAAEERLSNELTNQSRLYMERLLKGEEPSRTQDEATEQIFNLAMQAAKIDPDKDVEDVEWQESLRLLGVRKAADKGDGIPRFDVKFEVVQRIVGDGWETKWEASKKSAEEPDKSASEPSWTTEYDFENRLFWYGYSQNADIIQTMAIVVMVGAVLIVAWEVGALALLASAAGGTGPALAGIGISVLIYWVTHERHTVEGVLVAGITGYLTAVGFRLFAPVGQAAAKLILPAAIEEITFRQVVAAWVVRHGVTGGLSGLVIGPSALLVEDFVRVATKGGGFSPFGDYLKSAGYGMLLGAVFEIGGSLLLAPLFRAADKTVLSKLPEVVAMLRGREPPITASQWFAESAVSLGQFRAWLRATYDEAIANGIFASVKDKVALASSAWLQGTRATLQREVLELASVELTRDGLDGLEKLVRVGTKTLDDDTIATLLRKVGKTEQLQPWLKFLAEADETLIADLAKSKQLGELAESKSALALAAKRSAAEIADLLPKRFGSKVANLEAFAKRANALTPELADRTLDLLKTRGTAVTPTALLKMAESGAGLGEDVLTGLQRMLDGADAARMDAVLDAMAAEQVGPYLKSAQTAVGADLKLMKDMVANFEPKPVAWASTLAPSEANTLLKDLSAPARATITDLTPKEAQDLIKALDLKRVNDALSQGETGAVRGKHLTNLRRRLHDNSVKDLLDWAGTTPNRLARVASRGTYIEAGATRLPAGTNLKSTSLVLDTNTTAAIDELLRKTTTAGDPIPFSSLDQNRKDAINAIRAELGLGPYVDPVGGARPTLEHIVGPNADLRTTVVVAGEVVQGEATTGTSPVLGKLGAVDPVRSNPDYPKVLDELKAKDVGGKKGAADRAIVGDSILAATDAGVVPKLVTTDQDIVTALAKNFGSPKTFAPVPGKVSTWDQLNTHYPSGRFTVDILGHKLEIIFAGKP